MKKKFTIYSDLSKKQLLELKELYVQKKVNSMSHIDLKDFVLEIINHQIHDTIGKEEEMEAWREMSSFFGEEFEMNIQEIKQKFAVDETNQDIEIDNQQERLDLMKKNNIDSEKKDMWDD